ncbi:hypothetical protein BJX99DRAFT_163634 [Aspergillus californicus]
MASRKRRRSRTGDIPQSLIQNWQSTAAEGARPVVRRPATACEACRTAKVKCTGHQSACERCTSRGIRCQYSSPTTSSASNTVESSASPRNGQSHSTDHTPQLIEEFIEWPKDISPPLIDWSSLDLGQNTMGSLDSLDPGATNLYQQPAGQSITQDILSIPNVPPASQETCQCRTKLMLQVPEVNHVMQGRPHAPLDRIFKVTGNVLYACRNLIKCTDCQVSYADLVCVVAVLQQTGTCFEHIANEGLSTSGIRVSVGAYEIPIGNESKLGQILVMDLVAQANCLLSLLRSRGDSLVQSQSTTQDRLTQINMDYLQEVVKSFEHTLRSIAESPEQACLEVH